MALGTKMIAGVIASSAGYPDNQRRKSLPFAVFGTAGTEDFNYLELRMLDRALTTPHRLAIFEGGHTLPPDAVALQAIEWLELQAMKSGRKTRDEALIDQLFDKQQRAIAASTSPAATVRLLKELADDFTGLRDVSAAAARVSELSNQKDVKSALARERADEDLEARQLGEPTGRAASAGARRLRAEGASASFGGRQASVHARVPPENARPDRRAPTRPRSPSRPESPPS